MMGRYLLFCFDRYYPDGGMSDFEYRYAVKNHAMDKARERVEKEEFTDGACDQAQVFDTVTGVLTVFRRTAKGTMVESKVLR